MSTTSQHVATEPTLDDVEEWMKWKHGVLQLAPEGGSRAPTSMNAAIAAATFVEESSQSPWSDDQRRLLVSACLSLQRAISSESTERRNLWSVRALRYLLDLAEPHLVRVSLKEMTLQLPTECQDLWRESLSVLHREARYEQLIPAATMASEKMRAEARNRRLSSLYDDLEREQPAGQPIWEDGTNQLETAGRTFFQETRGADQPLFVDRKNRILRPVEHILHRETRRTKSLCRFEIERNLGIVAGAFDCEFAELFAINGDAEFELLATHGERKKTRKLPFESRLLSRQQRGIVIQVGKSGKAYCTNETNDDRFYVPLRQESRAELCAPVTLKDHVLGNRILGVLNCESNSRGHFRGGAERLIEEHSAKFAVDLLVYGASQSGGGQWSFWHPEKHGWTNRPVLDTVCQAISDSIDPDLVNAAVWCLDEAKQELYIVGDSNGYGSDFKTFRSLPDAVLKHLVLRGDLNAAERFGSRDDRFCKALRTRSASTETVLFCPFRPAAGRCGLLAVYLPEERLLPGGDGTASVLAEAMPHLARMIGELIVATGRVREAAAFSRADTAEVAACQAALPAAGPSGAADVYRDFFLSTFDAAGASIFARCRGNSGKDEIRVLSTSGLVDIGDISETERPMYRIRTDVSRGVYNVNEDESSRTAYLWKHPGVCVRTMNSCNPAEPGQPPGWPSRPRRRHVEYLPNEDRGQGQRLLTIVLPDIDESAVRPGHADRRTLGTDGCAIPWVQIRLSRAGNQPPFTPEDQSLFEKLTRRCMPGLQVAQQWYQSLHGASLETKPANDEQFQWKEHWQRPLLSRIRLDVVEQHILADLAAYCAQRWSPGDGAELEGAIMVRHRSADDDMRYRICEFHSPVGLPLDGQERTLAMQAGSIDPVLSPSAICQHGREQSALVLSYQTGAAGDPLGERAGIRIPVRSWSGTSLMQGVIAIDGQGRFELDVGSAAMLAYAGIRLAASWAVCDPLGTREFTILPDTRFATPPIGSEEMPARDMSEVLGDMQRQLKKVLGIRELSIWVDCRGKILGKDAALAPWQPLEKWRGYQGHSYLKDAARYGVLRDENRKNRWRIPLYLGTFAIGYCDCSGVAVDNLNETIGQIVAAWSQLLFLTDKERRSFVGEVNVCGEPVEPSLKRPLHEVLEMKSWNLLSATLFRVPSLTPTVRDDRTMAIVDCDSHS